MWVSNRTRKKVQRKQKSLLNNGMSLALKMYTVLGLCSTLCNAMDCSPPGSSVRGVTQARILEWIAISFSRGKMYVPTNVS